VSTGTLFGLFLRFIKHFEETGDPSSITLILL